MRSRSAWLCPLLLVLCLTACATPAADGSGSGPREPSAAAETGESPAPEESGDAAAREQAQVWLDATSLPPGAVRSETSLGGFNSYIGWPCVPVEELEAFWTIPGVTASETAAWLMEHPPAGLITTATRAASDPAADGASVGFIPEPGTHEGVVYTIVKTSDGVAIRAEVAALTESAVCEPLPDGGTWGPPGQG